MRNFDYVNPTKVIFGKETVTRIGSELKRDGIKKVLMLYGKSSIFKNGVYDTVVKSFKDNGVEFIELGGVKPNPVLSLVEEAIAKCRDNNIEAIVPVGGGSVYDSAKAIAAGAIYDGPVWDFFEGKARVKKALPIHGVLTLSATGSEMNGNSVVTKRDEDKKWAISGKALYPSLSIIDPTVQFTLPRSQTVNGAVDTITHVMELYCDKTPAVDIMKEYSEGIIRTTIKHTEVLLDQTDNYDSRAEFAWCATLALNGSNGTGRSGGDWSSHVIEHALSALYDIAHGAGLSIVFPAWAKYVYKEDVATFARFAEKVFAITEGSEEEKALAGIEALKDWYRKIGSPVSLKDANIPYEAIDDLADNAAMNGPFGAMKELHRQDIVEILKLAAE